MYLVNPEKEFKDFKKEIEVYIQGNNTDIEVIKRVDESQLFFYIRYQTVAQ